jgi:hypothetical protein
MGRACSTNMEKMSAYRIIVRESVGKRPLGIPRRSWEDNIKMDIRENWVVWTELIWLCIGTSRIWHN